PRPGRGFPRGPRPRPWLPSEVIGRERSAARRPGSPAGGRRESWSGREDLELRPPGPETGALPGYATPRSTGPLYTSRPPSRLPGILAHQLHELALTVRPLTDLAAHALDDGQHLVLRRAHRHHPASALRELLHAWQR